MPVSAHDIAAELRARRPGLPAKKLHKLLYYCQGHHLAVHGEPLFTETIEAWDMGPVVAELWRAEKYDNLTPPRQELGEAELNTIGYTLSRYGALTGTDLEILSHGEEPWLTANRSRRPGDSIPLDPEVITRYFRSNTSAESDESALNKEMVSKWLADTASRPIERGRALSREELAAEFAASEARLGG
ncbi:MAG TPA: type II toxin-antitoxin system antitoxin SocA domain-containing protein [Pseudonocardiaceae bacterium]|nr:type II toxin-antitoxin system antitoxin SocA domain-containing protein [Pseudonocardiaceae bacterium]